MPATTATAPATTAATTASSLPRPPNCRNRSRSAVSTSRPSCARTTTTSRCIAAATAAAVAVSPVTLRQLILHPLPASPPCNISLGPPAHHHHSMQSPFMHPGGGGGTPYTGLLNSGLYQQYLGQLLAANSAAAGGAGGVPPHPLNPMLLQAQLAALAAQNSQHLMAAAAGCYNNALTERLKAQAAAHRFAPYPLMGSPPLSSPPTAAPLGSPSPSGGLCTSSSAFKSLQGSRPLSAAALNQSHSPPVSPPHSRTNTPGAVAAAGSLSSSPPLPTTIGGMPHLMPIKSEPMGAATASPPLRSAENSRSSEIKNIENMINGLNGTSEGRFGLSH